MNLILLILCAVLIVRSVRVHGQMKALRAAVEIVERRAYQKGQQDERARHTQPLHEQVGAAYALGVRDTHRIWTQILMEKGADIQPASGLNTLHPVSAS